MRLKKLMASFFALIMCVSAFAMPTFAYTEVELEGGYDYTRFKNSNITLNVYNWGEYISNGSDDTLDVVKAFEEITGIRVNYTTFDSNETMYAKIRSGGGDYDIVIPSDYMIGRMIKEDMLAELNWDNIPNADFIYDTYKNSSYDPENKYSVAYTWGVVGLIYNTTMVDEGDLQQGWGLLWDEQYADNILMFNNSRDAFAIGAKMLGLSLNPQSEEEISQIADILKQQKNVVQAYVMDEVFDKMTGGEAAIAPYYVGDGITMMEDNEDLAMFIPEEGSNLYVDAMCVLKNSRNKEAAEMFINFMCETEVALANAEYIYYSTPHMGAYELLDEETQESELMYPPEDVISRCEMFNVLPDDINSAMDSAWSDVRSYDAGGSGWMMPIILLGMLVLAVLGFWRKYVRRKRNEF